MVMAALRVLLGAAAAVENQMSTYAVRTANTLALAGKGGDESEPASERPAER